MENINYCPNICINYTPLLKNYDKLYIHDRNGISIPAGYSPIHRPIRKYLAHGCINLDKPSCLSSQKVVSWMKKILNFKNMGHSEAFDSILHKESGTLIIYIGKTRRLRKIQQFTIKDYMCITRFHHKVEGGTVRIAKSIENLTGALFQGYTSSHSSKQFLHIKTVYQIRLVEYHENRQLAVFLVSCETGCSIKSLLSQIGMVLGVNSRILEIRRVRSGVLTENENMVTMHDVLDAMWLFRTAKDESYLRRVIMPLEVLLVNLKRLVTKDSAVNSLCYGAKLMLPGVLIFDSSIDLGDEVVLITSKGEAIAIGIAEMNAAAMVCNIFGSAIKIKRVIMERDTYPKRWQINKTKH